jgi:putative ABC transport system ATP-binding protein
VTPLLVVENVTRTFTRGSSRVQALQGVSLTLDVGEVVALVGRSGSGKTTLLNIIGGLDQPDDGHVVVDGQKLGDLDQGGLVRLRRDKVGFVFQSFGLLPFLSARENVGIPLRLQRQPAAEREQRVTELLTAVGLADHVEQRPGELSGGQQQRVAIARALTTRPRLLLADEPTGQLDSQTGQQVVALLHELVQRSQSAALVATHDPALTSFADRVLHLRDGRLQDGP